MRKSLFLVLMYVTYAAAAESPVGNKQQLALNLIQVTGMSDTIQKTFQETEVYLAANVYHGTDSAKIRQDQINSKVKNNFVSNKNKILKEAQLKLADEISKIFTEKEINYLIEAHKYPVMQKYFSFLVSEAYLSAINEPNIQLMKIKVETTQSLGQPSKVSPRK